MCFQPLFRASKPFIKCGMGAGNHAKNNISHKWVFFYVFFELEGNWRGTGGEPVRCLPVTLSPVLLAPDPPACWPTQSG